MKVSNESKFSKIAYKRRPVPANHSQTRPGILSLLLFRIVSVRQGQCPGRVSSYSNGTKNPIPVLAIPGLSVLGALVSGTVLNQSGLVLTVLNLPGPVLTVVNRSGPVLTVLNQSGLVLTVLNQSGPVLTVLNQSGPVLTVLNQSGPVLTRRSFVWLSEGDQG